MISNRLKSARLALGWSQQALSKATGYSQTHISQMESGDRLPSMETARTLATALKVDLGWLVGEPDPGDVKQYRADPRAAIGHSWMPVEVRQALDVMALETRFSLHGYTLSIANVM